jgi:hypothetical protein
MQRFKFSHLSHALQHILFRNLHHYSTLKVIDKLTARLHQSGQNTFFLSFPLFKVNCQSIPFSKFLFQLFLCSHATQQTFIDDTDPIAKSLSLLH